MAVNFFELFTHQRQLSPQNKGWETHLFIFRADIVLPIIGSCVPDMLLQPNVCCMHLGCLFHEYFTSKLFHLKHPIQLLAIGRVHLKSVKVWRVAPIIVQTHLRIVEI